MNFKINNKNLGEWAISRELLNEASKLIPPNGTILELGAGTGTLELRKFAQVISIESDEKYLPPPGEPYAHPVCLIPIDPQTEWYDREKMAHIAKEKVDLIIVDGPARTGRLGFFHNFDLFYQKAAIIIDDTHRTENLVMCEMIKRATGRAYEVKKTDGRRTFAVFKKVL
jgi:hypothetical protein